MQMLNSPNEHPAEKYVRWIIPALLVGAGIMFFNKIAGTLIHFFDNIASLMGSVAAAGVMTLVVGLPILYVIQNPALVSTFWRAISRKITAWFVKLDPLSFMDAFIEKLKEKRANLQRVKVKIEGRKVKLERKIQDLNKAMQFNMKKASAAKTVGNIEVASMLSRKASGDGESIKLYRPLYERMEKYLTFFEKLDNTLATTIEGTEYEVARKREEYLTIKDAYKGLSDAEIFINSDNEDAKVFQMSLAALEENVTQKIAYIDDFEKRSKGMLDDMDVEKQMMNDEGLRLLEEFEQNGGSFFNGSQRTVDGQAILISSAPLKKETKEFSKLLSIKK